MKKIGCLILIMLLGMTASAETSGNQLGLNALQVLYDGTHNQMVSPVSLALALSMVKEGAAGETRTEIVNALGGEEDWSAICEALEKSGLKIANAAFSTSDITVKSEYAQALSQYAAEWFPMDSDIVDRVNAWTKEHTDGLIEKLMDAAPSEETKLILLNAAAMDAEWYIPFMRDATTEEVFHAPEGDENVSMMRQEGYFEYAETEHAQLLRLRYRDSTLTMLIALPNEESDVKTVLSELSEQGLGYFSGIEGESYLPISLPRTDFSASNTLNEVLMSAGIRTAFEENADFSGITDTPLFLNTIRQKARLVIDEAGTKAAAVTEVCWATASLIVEEPIVFKADRPFVALIADEETGTICFAAVIANPAENG